MILKSIRLSNLTIGPFPGNRLVLPDSQAVDSKEGRYAVNDQDSPIHVDDEGEKEIRAEIEQLDRCADHRETEPGEVAQNSPPEERRDEHRPVREWLFQEMSENDLRGHPPEYK